MSGVPCAVLEACADSAAPAAPAATPSGGHAGKPPNPQNLQCSPLPPALHPCVLPGAAQLTGQTLPTGQ